MIGGVGGFCLRILFYVLNSGFQQMIYPLRWQKKVDVRLTLYVWSAHQCGVP